MSPPPLNECFPVSEYVYMNVTIKCHLVLCRSHPEWRCEVLKEFCCWSCPCCCGTPLQNQLRQTNDSFLKCQFICVNLSYRQCSQHSYTRSIDVARHWLNSRFSTLVMRVVSPTSSTRTEVARFWPWCTHGCQLYVYCTRPCICLEADSFGAGAVLISIMSNVAHLQLADYVFKESLNVVEQNAYRLKDVRRIKTWNEIPRDAILDTVATHVLHVVVLVLFWTDEIQNFVGMF